MAKKSKQKWNRAHSFRKLKSNRRRVGHYTYVFSTRGRYNKFLTFTHNPPKDKKDDFKELNCNINPNEKSEKSHVKKYYDISIEDAFEPGDYNNLLRIDSSDKPIVDKYKRVSHLDYINRKK